MSADWVRIGGPSLTAAINPFGAELSSLCDAQGREWMTDADPAFWTGRAPLLFPIVGALAGGRYRVDGAEYELRQHGFARRMPWTLSAQSADRATFILTDSAETLAAYPLAFQLEAAFVVTGATLTLTVTLTNTGARDLPASFGFHPAFAWPLPGAGDKSDHAIQFEAAEPAPLARLAGGLIAGHDRPSPLVGGTILPLSDALFDDDALIWGGLNSRSVRYAGPQGQCLTIAFPDADKLGIWTKPGARFVCIEPWWGIADPVGFAGDIWEKPGILHLAPDERRSFTMAMTLS